MDLGPRGREDRRAPGGAGRLTESRVATPRSSPDAAGAEEAPLRRTLILLFAGCLIVYNANCRIVTTGDSTPARLLPFAILNHSTLYLDAFGPPKPGEYWFSRVRGEHLASLYPIVLPVLITPLFVPAALYVAAANPDSWRFWTLCELMEKSSASLIAAVSVLIFFLAARHLTSRGNALLLTLVYAFATQTWSTSSQALWQHGLGELLLAAALYLLIRFGASPRAALGIGALCGLTAFNRPPNALFAVAIGLYYVFSARRSVKRFALGAIAAGLPFLAYNLVVFGKPLGGYQLMPETELYERFSYPILDGVAALLVSPGKGLFVYAPFFLFLFSAPLLRLEAAGRKAVILLWSAFLGQLILYAATRWNAGASYGPRFLADASPFLVLSLVPAVERLRSPVGKTAFLACVAFAIWVQAVGAFCFPKGGSQALTLEQYWKPSGAQFWIEAKAGLARPEYLHRAAAWIKRRFDSP